MNVPAKLRVVEFAILSQDAIRAPAAERDAVASFDRLAAEQYGRIARLVDRLCGWRGDREDLVQEVFVSAWQAWPKFRQESQAETWLTRIAINHCRSHQRRRWLRDAIWERLSRFVRDADDEEPHEPLARREDDAEIRHSLDQLPQRDREVLVLRYLEDLAVDDIAETLALKRGAVEVRLTRARARLKQIMEANERPRA